MRMPACMQMPHRLHRSPVASSSSGCCFAQLSSGSTVRRPMVRCRLLAAMSCRLRTPLGIAAPPAGVWNHRAVNPQNGTPSAKADPSYPAVQFAMSGRLSNVELWLSQWMLCGAAWDDEVFHVALDNRTLVQYLTPFH